MKKNIIQTAICEAQKILDDAISIGISMQDAKEKLCQALALMESDEVSIALLGSFSDGKTTVISGLIGQIMENMKIDANESSDEISVYEVPFLGKKFRFVDTPGLFGSKEKISTLGKKVGFSSLTEDYISQANAVIYITEASNPLPESHQESLRHVMRTLRKLESAIFVINKMDEKYDITDDEEFKEGTRVKTENLRTRLMRCLDLSSQEADDLRIVCLAANPKSKGLEYWFNRPDSYARRSHIDVLQNEVVSMSKDLNENINQKTALDTAIDVIENLGRAIVEAKRPVQEAITKSIPIARDLNDRMSMTQTTVLEEKKSMIKSLDSLEFEVKSAIQSMSQDTASEILNNVIGVGENGVDFSIVIRKIETALNTCSESVSSAVKRVKADVLSGISLTESLVNDALKDGINYLKDVNISPEMVGKIRDMFFKNFKFKPYGKINMANKINKIIGGIGFGIELVIEIYDGYKQRKNANDFAKAKEDLLSVATDLFNRAHSTYRDEKVFMENFAPALIQLKKIIYQQEQDIEQLKSIISQMDQKRDEINRWKKEYAEDVEYTIN